MDDAAEAVGGPSGRKHMSESDDAMEGALLASRQLDFLSSFYSANALAMVAGFAAVERAGLGLHAAWACMLAFQIVRLAVFGARLRLRRGGDDVAV